MNSITKSDSEKSVDNGLAIEYRQKQFCDTLVQKFLQLSEERNPNSRRGGGRGVGSGLREATNIVERWILSLQQADAVSDGGCSTKMDKQLPLFPIGMRSDDQKTKLLASDAYDKGFCRLRRSATNLAIGMLAEVERFRRSCHDSEKFLEQPAIELRMLDEDRGCIRVGHEFQSSASRRLPYLAQRFGLAATARMLLRYESLGSGSYQWGDPLSVHRVYYRDFGARYEGFSSPLNSRFLGLDEAGFCSLFPDTDSVFGSLGNFFNIDLTRHTGGWSVNPPFIESVLEEAARRVTDCLDRGTPSWFFMNFPDWRDSPGWSMLDSSPHKLARFDFSPGEFLIQDAYGRASRPKMKLSIFALGRLPHGSPPIKRLRDAVFKARPVDLAEEWTAATF
ncbi:hypothetical protein BOX15_Mlig008908g1 [Macrostomum lignano]|uniref:PCIF1 WW domain-containing protein n=1 Tax=Macrostomum lignano TaxID=282301 RepID=A0A267F2C5_9PLAT|nr:hypothetical protein BOX15_Mlig008908g1 [Macrostomum lignano]